jgi:hypothetical protein
VGTLGLKSVRVCRGVLRVWGSRIQDSRTDFWGFWRKMIESATKRGWCKIVGVPKIDTIDGVLWHKGVH